MSGTELTSEVISAKNLFKGTRRELGAIPTTVPEALFDYPGAASLPADCIGDRVGCAWNSPGVMMPALPCGQRCQAGEARAGSAAWYRSLIARVDDRGGAPIYLLGSQGGQRARLAFVDRGLLLRDDLVGSVMPIPEGCADPDALMPKGARRDARIGERGGLLVRQDASDAGIDAFYGIYRATCERLAIRPLPRTFLAHERDRAPDAFFVILAELGGDIVAGKAYLMADGLLRIIEGSSVHDDEAVRALMPDVFLTREVLRHAISADVRFVDYGINEGQADGLRAFKRRMGFLEDPRVVSVERLPPMSAVRQDVALLEACNFGCGFCYREPWVPDLGTEECRREIDAVARLRDSGIALSGGEPTLRDDLPELITYARSRGIRDIQLHTNGWKLTDPGYSEGLKDAGLTSTMISLHAHSADIFARVTRTRPEYFERTLDAIDAARAAGIPTLLSHVVNAYNYEGLPDWVDFVSTRFPGIEIFFFFVYPSVKGLEHPDLYPRLSDVAPYWYEALRRVDGHGLSIHVDSLAGFPMCFMQGFEHHSKYFYALDHEAAHGDEANDHTLKSPEMRHGAGCAGCKWEAVCPGFWIDYLDRFGEDELQAILPTAG